MILKLRCAQASGWPIFVLDVNGYSCDLVTPLTDGRGSFGGWFNFGWTRECVWVRIRT
jgi:hypothetical protein